MCALHRAGPGATQATAGPPAAPGCSSFEPLAFGSVGGSRMDCQESQPVGAETDKVGSAQVVDVPGSTQQAQGPHCQHSVPLPAVAPATSL